MPLNIPGLLVPFHLLIYPRLVVPHINVRDIRQIDFRALKESGYKGAIFDKDNCLTIPHKDVLVPELTSAWHDCRRTFGEGNVLVVSNSAGTSSDPGGIQAESVRHHLEVPVLLHSSLKPSYKTIQSIRTYFSSLPAPIREEELVVVGDRLFTDVVLAHRLRRKDSEIGPLSIWTTGLWEREALFMRWCEKLLLSGVQRWSKPTASYDQLSGLSSRVTQPISKD
ncbi:HAD phosphatase [Flagelloscypha sp. PMI_526]|nr:HAD phosphatase [Flagelloscypha sp. PMI_526]